MTINLDQLEADLKPFLPKEPEPTALPPTGPEPSPFNPPRVKAGSVASEYFPSDEEQAAESQPESNPLPPILDAVDFLANSIPLPEEICGGMFHRGSKIIIGGGSKSFKTWVLLDMAFSVAHGLTWLGVPTFKGKVLYVNFEIQAPFMERRMRSISKARGIDFDAGQFSIWNLRGRGDSYETIIPKIIATIQDQGFVLVVIDPIYKIYGKAKENAAEDVAAVLNSLERVCVEANAAVAIGAHYSKGNQSSKEAIDRVSGSGVFARDPDSLVNFTQHEEPGAFTVEATLRNLPPMESFVVRWNYPLMERDEQLNPNDLKQAAGVGKKKEHDPIKILSYIKTTTYHEPISSYQWATAAGINRNTLNDYISNLRTAGLIATVGEGTSARKYITPKGVLEVQNAGF